MANLRRWITLCEGTQLFKVGDWVYSDIARDTGRVKQRDLDDDTDIYFYSVQWDDGTVTQDIPEMTLRRTATPPAEHAVTPPTKKPRTPPPHLRVENVIKGRNAITIDPAASIAEAAQQIARYNVGVLPVVSDGGLVGIISERDIISKVVAIGGDVHTISVAEAMTRHPVTVGGGDLLSDALSKMNTGNFRHLPITSAGRVLGVLSLRDAIAPLWNYYRR